jgi:hypothetical protein
MKQTVKSDQSGLIPLLICVFLAVGAVIVIAFLRVRGAK